jgi:molybdate transport system substrate-binding protein
VSGTIDFISAGAAAGLVQTVAATAGVKVAGSFGAVGAMQEKFLAGEACDIVILSHAQVADLAARGLVAARTAADLGSVPTSIALREGDAAIDVSNETELRAALLAADAIYFPDAVKSTAGKHFDKVLHLLGIRGEVDARLRPFPNGATAMREMAAATGHPIGCTQATEILATPGVRVIAPLPKGFDLETVYSVAVSSRAAHREDAEKFAALLASDASRAARTAAGFKT